MAERVETPGFGVAGRTFELGDAGRIGTAAAGAAGGRTGAFAPGADGRRPLTAGACAGAGRGFAAGAGGVRIVACAGV
ncbi:MAG: hypothetical protein JWN40_1269, partial [Phycisphaerales bacterium]|nr:hypothetical protein [Phycisphaerales bacterium]